MPDFRKATQEDAGTIAALEAKFIECPWSEKVVRETVADELSVLYLLCEGDAILGYGGLKMALDTAEVYNIVVDAPYRRRGYGGRILDKLVSVAVEKGGREMLLEVNEHNEAAINLYAAHGFKILHMRKHYYRSGNAYVMRLPL